MVKFTTEKFIEKAIKKHGPDRYDYSLSVYQGSKAKLIIKCNKCGHTFEQAAYMHWYGHGCPKCAVTKNAEKSRLTLQEFIQKAESVHGKGIYDYSFVNYINNDTNVKIKCLYHDSIFEQKAGNHLNGAGCPECGKERQHLSIDEFIKKAEEIHGKNRFDYSSTLYKGYLIKVTIKCNKCGHIFKQTPKQHLKGVGCIKCRNLNRISTLQAFIKKAEKVHDKDRYDYSLSAYNHSHKKIIIKCNKCNYIFKQAPYAHLSGRGCPNCAIAIQRSKGEKELCQYIKSLYSGEILENTRKFIGGKELDIYLPELKLTFEYNGEYWHQFHEEKEPGYHKNKRKACKENGIKLIEVWENDWKKNNQQIKDLISKHLQI